MDDCHLARLHSLKAHTAAIEQQQSPSGRIAQIADSIARHQLLLLEPRNARNLDADDDEREVGANPGSAAVDAWCAAVAKLFSRQEASGGGFGSAPMRSHSLSLQCQANAAALLGATASSCSPGRLADSLQAWGILLLDLGKRLGGEATSGGHVMYSCLHALGQLFAR